MITNSVSIYSIGPNAGSDAPKTIREKMQATRGALIIVLSSDAEGISKLLGNWGLDSTLVNNIEGALVLFREGYKGIIMVLSNQSVLEVAEILKLEKLEVGSMATWN